MKRFLLGAAALVAMSVSASAADLPAQTYSKAPMMMPALYDWSGFYLGLNGGWGTEHRCWDTINNAGTVGATDGCHDASGGFAGGQMGYRFQTGPWVYGLDLQGDWANLKGSSVSIGTPTQINRSRMDAFGIFTGQIGYAFNTALVYFKGGAAVVADRNDIVSATTGTIVATAGGDNRWGGTIGLGAEFTFAPNWSAAVEWDHLFIANNNTVFTTAAGNTISTDRVRGDADMVSVRVNYRWGGPVVAKY